MSALRTGYFGAQRRSLSATGDKVFLNTVPPDYCDSTRLFGFSVRSQTHLPLLPSLHKLTDASHTGKQTTILPFLYLSAWFPQSVFRLGRIQRISELRCFSQARPGWQYHWNMSGETGKETATVLLFPCWSASSQLQTKLQTSLFLLPSLCLSEKCGIWNAHQNFFSTDNFI